MAAFLNRDPKTLSCRVDACTRYGEEDARWKARPLRCHDSQQQRNLNTRGRRFDERILEHDRRNAAECGGAPNAEVFEIEITDSLPFYSSGAVDRLQRQLFCYVARQMNIPLVSRWGSSARRQSPGNNPS
jgi:hypothetical protein